jgi:hypothetical protein
MEIIIYGLPKGETRDYMEDILANFESSANDQANIEKVKAVASAQGFHSFRVATFNWEKPDFAKAARV